MAKQSSFVAVEVDESTDTDKTSQMAVCLRFLH